MRDHRRAGLRRAELRQHAAGHDQDEQALPEILDVPDFDAQSFANTLRDMAETSKLLPEIFDSLRRDAAEGRLWLQPPHFAARRADEWCWPVLPGATAPTPASFPYTRL